MEVRNEGMKLTICCIKIERWCGSQLFLGLLIDMFAKFLADLSIVEIGEVGGGLMASTVCGLSDWAEFY